MCKIELIKFTAEIDNYKLMHKWCGEEFIYKWFEQRVLSYDEIVKNIKTNYWKESKNYF